MIICQTVEVLLGFFLLGAIYEIFQTSSEAMCAEY